MSAIGGIFNFYQRPVERDRVVALSEALATRGPDGGNAFRDGPIGICYRAWYINHHSRLESQPLVSADGRILAGDLRLDNREELIPQLDDLLKSEPQEVTDIEIAMAAHERWGDLFSYNLIGEFALILMDRRNGRLLLTRDPAGVRTLYYHHNGSRIVCSSELAPLIDLADVSLEVSDEYVAGFLARDPAPGLTAFNNVRAVPPAHTLTIGPEGRTTERRFWGLNPNKLIRYKCDREYEENFLDHFSHAVRTRLRSDKTVFAELSGGLDSSSIVCVADWILAKGEAEATWLETVSYVFDESPSADERKFIRCVEEQRGKPGHHLREEDYRVLAPVINAPAIGNPNPILCSEEYHRGIGELLAQWDARVLLSGQGGDEVMGSGYDPAPELADLLIQGQLLTLHGRLQIWSQCLKTHYLGLLWDKALIPNLPSKVQLACRRGPSATVPEWFDQQFVSRLGLRERMLGPKDEFGFRLPSGRDQAIGFLSVMQSIATGHRREQLKVEVTYPYLHRPLVEFMQAIPFEQRVRPHETRSLMRRAMDELLPAKIARRRSKGCPTEVTLRAIAREWTRLRPMLEDARVCRLGYMDPKLLLVAIDRAKHGCTSNSVDLLKSLALEFWLRALEACTSQSRQRGAVGHLPAAGITLPGRLSTSAE
jgi:asparagine synthase (glutamine-hydrolysing)